MTDRPEILLVEDDDFAASVTAEALASSFTVIHAENGQAALGLISILKAANTKISGVGIVIEKSFQTGRALVEETGIPVFSLARIAGFDQGQVVFTEADL
mgnify:CR=1 FL=1